jgi:16S rRNA (uracil1498-N3)-methyltransferase
MTRKCFLIEPQDPGEGVVSLAGEVAHHVRNVLRLRPGDGIELRDGRGNGWAAVIKEIRGREVRVALGSKQAVHNESPLQLTLALAFSRFDRMEMVLRQATELGIQRFIAFRSERCEHHQPASQLNRRLERWRKITREALCQCGRMRLPEVLILADTAELISCHSSAWGGPSAGAAGIAKDCSRGLKIVAREDADRQSLINLSAAHPICHQALVVVGPEGGWSWREGEQFVEAGFLPVHLGPRTLRLETAAVALVAVVQLLWGDLGEANPESEQRSWPASGRSEVERGREGDTETW